MNWKSMNVVGLILIAVAVLVLAVGHRSQAQAQVAGPVAAAFAYKVERVGKNDKDADRILTEDGKAGWRINRVLTVGPYHNDLVFVMEKPAGSN